MAKRWNRGQQDANDVAFFAHNFPTSSQPKGSHMPNFNRGRGVRGRGRGHHSRPYRVCFYCNKAGHTIDQCRKRLRNSPQGDKTNNSNNHAAAAILIANNHNEQPEKEQVVEETAFLSVPNFSKRGIHSWFADSGATQHMTCNRSYFNSFTPVEPRTWSVQGIGSSCLAVCGFGSIEFVLLVGGVKRKATIHKVLFVPGLGTNLISYAAVTDVGMSVHFVETQVSFTKDETIVMVGKRVGRNLYNLAIYPRLQDLSQESACLAVPSATSITIWHQRLAHLSYKTIKQMAADQLVNGLTLPPNEAVPNTPCLGCMSGKMKRSPFPIGRTRALHVGQLVHTDLCGPMHVSTPGGARFFILFTDDFSGWRAAYFLKEKSEAADCFKNYVATTRSETSHLIHTLRTDNGGEFTKNSFKEWLTERAIRLETSAPYTPEQNGVSERANRTIVEAGRSMLHAKHFPLELWGEAISCAVYVLNRAKSSVSTVTPFESWFCKKPDISHLRVFGSIAFIHVPKAQRRKLDSKSLKCFFVGYSLTQKAYRFWDPAERKIKISRDVIFDEKNDHLTLTSEQQLHCSTPNIAADKQPTCAPALQDLLTPGQSIRNSTAQAEERAINVIQPELASDSYSTTEPNCEEVNTIPMPNVMPDTGKQNEATPTEQGTSDLPPNTSETPIERIRHSPYPLRVRRPKRQWESLISAESVDTYEPVNYADAMSSDEADLWKIAIKEEYDSLLQNKTWSLTKLPAGRIAIKSKWVFKVKHAANGSAPRYKARLVAKGFSQRPGIDFEETYAPVIKHNTLRVILALTAAQDLELSQLDVKTAFLYGELDEEIYLQQPEGFVAAGKEDHVCKLHKSLYGLKQASRVWNRHFDGFLKLFGLKQSKADSCLYMCHNRNEFAYMAIWVDDGLICSNSALLTSKIVEYLSNHFDMRHGPADNFVGLSIHRARQERTLFMSQPDYTKRVLQRFHMTDCHPVKLPAEPGSHLGECAAENPIRVPYREAIGSLTYLATVSRPDMSFSVGQASRYCEEPKVQHWTAVKKILAYVKGTAQHGIRYTLTADGITGFCDSEYAGDPNTRRSTSGFIFILCGGPVAWSSRRQPCVALSSTEAEFVASCDAAKEGVWLKRLLSEMMPGLSGPIPLMCDNQSAIQLVLNPVFHQRTKHIDVRFRFVRERQETGDIDVLYVPSVDQLADPLTKSLPNPRFTVLRQLSGITAIPLNTN